LGALLALRRYVKHIDAEKETLIALWKVTSGDGLWIVVNVS